MIQEIAREASRIASGDPEIATRINSYEMAYRMQSSGPELIDFSKESRETLEMYGADRGETQKFGQQCLLARRFAENGVRFVQCTHSYKWDQHENLKDGHENNAREVDQPIAGLIHDLAARGLLAAEIDHSLPGEARIGQQ